MQIRRISQGNKASKFKTPSARLAVQLWESLGTSEFRLILSIVEIVAEKCVERVLSTFNYFRIVEFRHSLFSKSA